MKFHPNVLLLSIFLITSSVQIQAGLKWVDIGVNGLTCSMCTRSVEMSISRLNFVDKVNMSLENTEGRIYLKEGLSFDLNKIVKAVIDAGFSVRYLSLTINFNDLTINKDGVFTIQDQTFIWLQYKEETLKGDIPLKLIDENFMPKKERIKWKKKIEFSNLQSNQKVFHVVQQG